MNLLQWKQHAELSIRQIAEAVGFTDHTRVAKHLSGCLLLSAKDAAAYIKASGGLITIQEIAAEGEANAKRFDRLHDRVPSVRRVQGKNHKPGSRRTDRSRRARGASAR